MKRLLMLGLAMAAGLFTTTAKADVSVHIGAGVPGVVIGTHRPPHVHYRHHHPSVRHRYYGPPVVYYPEKIYRHPHRHYQHKHYKHVRPPVYDRHLRQGQRPLPPPHAHARGHWRR